MKKFLEPDSVAVIGVPRQTGPGSYNNVETLVKYGYPGKIFPVNPNAEEIYGFKVYPSVTALPETPDLAVISLGRERVLKAVEECGAKGIGRAIIITQGFSDSDRRGSELQEMLVKAAAASDMRLIGPNTMGVLDNFSRFTTSFIDLPFPEKFEPVSIICQSGIFQVGANVFNFYNWGKVIDIGNAADVGHLEAIEYLADDEETKVIVLHIEGLKQGRDFLDSAARISRIKPIIAYKTGRTEAGARAAVSHSGALAAEDTITEAAFKRAGLIRVNNADECKDAIKAVLKMREMKGTRVGILTFSGAAGIMAVDACDDHGLKVAEVPAGLSEKLTQGLPDWIHVADPVDIWPISMIGGDFKGSYSTALEGLLTSPKVDGVIATLLSFYKTPMHVDLDLFEQVRSVYSESNCGKPLAFWVYPDDDQAIQRFESMEGIGCFKSMERAVRGLAYAHKLHQSKKRRAPVQKKFTVNERAAGKLADKGRSEGLLLGEDALGLLKAFGIPVARGKVSGNIKELEAAAVRFGYPVVLKVSGKAFIHKSDIGGIILDINSRTALRNACKELAGRFAKKRAAVEFHLQKQAAGKEILLGLKRDPNFGHVIICGAGGIYTESLRDVSHDLVPVDRSAAEQMLKQLRIWPVLKGTRGQAGVNVNALFEMIERLSFLAGQIPEISELDINPVIASARDCRAVDARIIWS